MSDKSTVCVGYTCPLCGKRVSVMRSSEPAPTGCLILSECRCGYLRTIKIVDVQSLDVWRESASAA